MKPIIFETRINGRKATATIESCEPGDREQSYGPEDWEEIARDAFARMSPDFDRSQPIRRVDN